MKLGETILEEAAREAAGNWKTFESFWWDRGRELKDADNWTIIYTRHRDSGVLDQSNAAVIRTTLEPFLTGDDPDVVPERHDHWVVGWIDGYSMRVYRDSQITDAFGTYHGLVQQLADYPVLSDEDYSRREYEATIQNLSEAAWRVKNEHELPKGWQAQVYDWLSEHDCSAIESSNDQGGWPSEGQLNVAFEALWG